VKPALGWLRYLAGDLAGTRWRADAEKRQIGMLIHMREEIRALRKEADKKALEAYTPEEIKRAKQAARKAKAT